MTTAALPNGQTNEGQPLAGCRVIDLTRILSGPYATMMLADLGADVIKVERPDHGDDTRGWGPPFWKGTSAYFAAINRGKRSLALDLRQPAGRTVLRELIAKADVLVENFRPGVTERLGISYSDVVEQNPRLIYASINGYGSHGPRAHEAGTEVIIEAESGLMAMMGIADGPPVRFGVAMVDIATGMALVNGVLAALLQRARTGRGRVLEFSLYGTAIAVLATVIASACVEPDTRQARFGSGHPSIVPYSAFEATDGWVVLGAVNEAMWARLCRGLRIEAMLSDPRSATNEQRVNNRGYVEHAVARAVAGMTVAQVVDVLGVEGVLVAPVKTATQAVLDPQVAALGLIDVDDGVKFARSPLAQFNEQPLARAPALGEHTSEILTEFGVADSHLRDLIASGVAHQGPAAPADERADPLAWAAHAST